MRLADLLQLRGDDVHDHDDRDPAQEDRHREQPDETRDHRMGADVRVAHADFTKQKVWAFTPSEVLSSLTTPSTVMRQVMLLPSLCAMMFGLTVAPTRGTGRGPR